MISEKFIFFATSYLNMWCNISSKDQNSIRCLCKQWGHQIFIFTVWSNVVCTANCHLCRSGERNKVQRKVLVGLWHKHFSCCGSQKAQYKATLSSEEIRSVAVAIIISLFEGIEILLNNFNLLEEFRIDLKAFLMPNQYY